MDRCRCPEYAEAVKGLKFYTVGTLRPDIIDNFDRTGYMAVWVKNAINLTDLKVSKPRALKILEEHELPENRLPKDVRKIEQMWCPFMTPYVMKN